MTRFAYPSLPTIALLTFDVGVMVAIVVVHLTLWPLHLVVTLLAIPLILTALVAPRWTTVVVVGIAVLLQIVDALVDQSRGALWPSSLVFVLGSAFVAWEIAQRRLGARPELAEAATVNTHCIEGVSGGTMDWESKTSVRRAVDGYVQAWNAPSRQQRLLLLDEFWAEDGAYLDRRTSLRVEGPVDLAAYVERVRQDHPGHVFELAGPLDEHHGFFRIVWALRRPDGQSHFGGTDFGHVDDGGRITLVVRFHGQPDDRAPSGAL